MSLSWSVCCVLLSLLGLRLLGLRLLGVRLSLLGLRLLGSRSHKVLLAC